MRGWYTSVEDSGQQLRSHQASSRLTAEKRAASLLLFHFSDVVRYDGYRLEASCIILVECHSPEHMEESAVTVNDSNLLRKVSLLVRAPF